MKKHLVFVCLAFLSGLYLLGNFLYRVEISGIPQLPLKARAVPERGLVITEARDAALAAGVPEGNSILAIDGRSTEVGQYYFLRSQRLAQPGDEVILKLGSSESSREVTLQWERRVQRQSRSGLLGTPVSWHRFFFNLLLPLALWVIAFTLNFSTAEGPTRIWASLMILSQTVWFPEEPKLLWPLGFREFGYLFNGVFGPLFFVFALVFFTRFPIPLGSERRFPWLKWVLLAALLSLGTIAATHSLSSIYHFGLYTLTSQVTEWVKGAIQLFWLLCLLFICASRVRLPERISAYERSRMGLIWWGIFVGFLPPCLLLFLGLFDPQQRIAAFPDWLQMLPFLFFLAFPLSVAISVIGWRRPLYTDSSEKGAP